MKITKYFTCQSTDLVYAIKCSKCSKLYVGETGRSLATRFSEHLADIRHNRDKTVAHHFNASNHSVQDVRVLGIWKMFLFDTNARKDMEKHLIKKLGTKKPHGLNEL